MDGLFVMMKKCSGSNQEKEKEGGFCSRRALLGYVILH